MAETVEKFLRALEVADLDAVAATLAPGVVFHSPITNRARFEGYDAVVALYRAVLDTLSEVEGSEIATGPGGVHILRGSAKAGGRRFDETTVLRLDDQGRIVDITLFVRDLAALAALTAAIGPRVARQHGAWRAPLTALLSRPLALLTALGDRIAARLAGIG